MRNKEQGTGKGGFAVKLASGEVQERGSHRVFCCPLAL